MNQMSTGDFRSEFGGVSEVPYVTFHLGENIVLHQLQTSNYGELFIASEVASVLLGESPAALVQELRQGRYAKVYTQNRSVIMCVTADLRIDSESSTQPGFTLIPSDSLDSLLHDKRRPDLVRSLRLALLRNTSRESSRAMELGDYEIALPKALDAVKRGQEIFKGDHSINLFPLYLLAAQANLGLKRAKPCEDFLGLASWLLLKDPANVTNGMQSQVARIFGQLHLLEKRYELALQSFAEDTYHCALEFGPQDMRTALGYYNIAKVFQDKGEMEKCLSCLNQLQNAWIDGYRKVILGELVSLSKNPAAHFYELIPLNKVQHSEMIDIIKDVQSIYFDNYGISIELVKCFLAKSFIYLNLGDFEGAGNALREASEIFEKNDANLNYTDVDVEHLISKVKVVLSKRIGQNYP